MTLPSIPPSTQALLNRIVAAFVELFHNQLIGVYLHGSLVLGGFNETTSDIDFLIVLNAPIAPELRQPLLTTTLALTADAPPKGLEFSIVQLRHTLQPPHPCPFDLHYGKDHHQLYETGDLRWEGLVDYDLVAHFTITREHGRVLHGPPIREVFGPVPIADYWDSIWRDGQDILADIQRNPVYGVLNLCRIHAYQRDRVILSKLDAAAWGLAHLLPRYHPLLAQARDVYQASIIVPTWDTDLLTAFAEEMSQRIADTPAPTD